MTSKRQLTDEERKNWLEKKEKSMGSETFKKRFLQEWTEEMMFEHARPKNLHPLSDVPVDIIEYTHPKTGETKHYYIDENKELRVLIYPRRQG